jgi:metallo-beta-lactamase family protein
LEISFHGAAGGVTGSCHMIHANGKRVLLDCGMFQGRRKEARKLNLTFGFNPNRVDAVVQSHAHIDHSGKLPLLVDGGFPGKIHATHGTQDLCAILLRDCAHILLRDALYLTKKRMKEHARKRKLARRRMREVHDFIDYKADLDVGKISRPIAPIYLKEDVEEAMKRFKPHRYGDWFSACDGMRFRFHDAGHILGSAWVEAEITEGTVTKRLVFTGDYGRSGAPLLRKPQPLVAADIYLAESTYGDRLHPPFKGMRDGLAAAVRRLAERGVGKLLIPAFAVGRTQDLLFHLGQIFKNGEAPTVPVYVDSPLATEATGVARKHREYFNQSAMEALNGNGGEHFALMPGAHFVESANESKALNHHKEALIVISASGMMEQGRILHHLIHALPRDDCELMVVGYQAEGTLGRRVIEGADEVRILGETVRVKARVENMTGFSAHADRNDLLNALTPHAASAEALFLVHGEDDQRNSLADEFQARGFSRVEMPQMDQSFSL